MRVSLNMNGVTGYHEQANTLKLVRPEGDIDFIVAAPVIPGARPVVADIDGRRLALDQTSEILAKKRAYRADGFKARDVFDMATALALDRPSAMTALRATVRTRPALMTRLKAMQGIPAATLTKDLAMTDTGHRHADGMLASLLSAIKEADRLSVGPSRDASRRAPGNKGGMEP